VTSDFASTDDADRRHGGDNGRVAETQPDPLDDVAALLARAAAGARRIFSGPDGPLTLALALALITTAEVTLYTEEVPAALIGNLLATLPLALVRKRLPWAATMVVLGAVLALAEGTLTISGLFGLLVVLYLCASRYRRRWCVVAALPFFVNAVAPYSGDDAGFSSVLLLFVVVGALALGDSRRERGQAIAERDETRRAMRDTLEDQAAMGERARIARDLHDIVAHHVSAIAVEAETARLTTKRLPTEGREHFESIGRTARDALDEMRRLLGVLRADADDGGERVPQPGLGQLGELIETARAAGSTVRLTMSGQVTALPPGVDLCAYRIVQEALTNARRHAPGATVDIEIAYNAESVRLAVRDDGPGPADGELEGHGLLGMRERATIAGGTLRVGSSEGGGFSVESELPIPAVAR
jgi:signal transduction histidine kinase